MNRVEFIQRLVLNEICDDFENVDQVILRDVALLGAKIGLIIERADVVEALAALVETGMAKAYDLRNSKSRDPFDGELPGMPTLDAVQEDFPYFYVTAKGMEFHEADSTWWPFDDEGSIRTDWNPPEPSGP